MRISVKDRLEQCRSDTLPLILRKYQNILNQNNGEPIADNPNDSKEFIVFE